MYGGAWWATVHGVAKSRTQLKPLSSRSKFPGDVKAATQESHFESHWCSLSWSNKYMSLNPTDLPQTSEVKTDFNLYLWSGFEPPTSLSSVQFSCSVMSDSLQPHGLQHAWLPCPSLSPGICSNSCPLRWWYHPTISSFVIPFSFCLQSSLASGSFPMVSSSHQMAKVLELQLQHQSFQWIFRTDFL